MPRKLAASMSENTTLKCSWLMYSTYWFGEGERGREGGAGRGGETGRRGTTQAAGKSDGGHHKCTQGGLFYLRLHQVLQLWLVQRLSWDLGGG